jgi:hypothetical protein
MIVIVMDVKDKGRGKEEAKLEAPWAAGQKSPGLAQWGDHLTPDPSPPVILNMK